MESYRKLFSLDILHSYFVQNAWLGLDFLPTEKTRRMFLAIGAMLRVNRNQVSVFFDAGRSAAMRLLMEEAGNALSIVLKATVRDRTFHNYTYIPRLEADAMLRFSNKVSDAGTQPVALSREDAVLDGDVDTIADILNAEVVADSDIGVPPDFVIDIRLSQTMIDHDASPEFRINFTTRSLFWNYFLLGNVNRENLFIVDLDDKVRFDPVGDGVSVAHRPAKLFRSNTVLPIQEMSNLRFQLRERGNGSGKIVVRRLPVAADNFGFQLVDGERLLVSNMFVNF